MELFQYKLYETLFLFKGKKAMAIKNSVEIVELTSCMTPSKRNTSNTLIHHYNYSYLFNRNNKSYTHNNNNNNSNNSNNNNNNNDIFKRSYCSSTCHHWRQCLFTVRQIFPSTGKFNKLISTRSPCQRQILRRIECSVRSIIRRHAV